MMMTGQPLDMKKAKRAGLVDLVVPKGGNLIEAAVEFGLAKNGKVRPISKMKPTTVNKIKAQAGGLDMAQLQASKAAKGMVAPDAIVECVRACVLGGTDCCHILSSASSIFTQNFVFQFKE